MASFARRFNVSTERLRRLDSLADQIFWILIGVATFIECPDFFYSNHIKLIVLLGVEALTYAVSYLRFKKEVATHAIASKIWTLILFATLIEVVANCQSGLLFQLFFYVGMITRIEIILITIILPKWTNDVPSVYHAILLKQGKQIKKNKIFNV